MKYFLIVVLVAATTALHAQQFAENSATSLVSPAVFKANRSLRLPDKTEMLPGQRMRNTGRTLTLFGAALLVGGVAVVSSADAAYYTASTGSNGSYEEGDPQGALGVLMIAGGAGMVVPGIIFWSKGSKKYKAALEQNPNASLHLRANGMAIRYRF